MIDKPRLVVVDDDPQVLDQFQQLMTEQFDVLRFTQADEALDCLNHDSHVHMLFTDLDMPDRTGLDLLRQVRQSKFRALKTLPVVLMTEPHDDSQKIRDALTAGVTDLIRKPLDPDYVQARAQLAVKRFKAQIQPDTATVDPLTQLANEPYFLMQGSVSLALAQRQYKHVAIVLLRIDDFHAKAKRHGQSMLNGFLVKLGTYITEELTGDDIVARLDEDTFGVIIMQQTPQAVTDIVATLVSKIADKELLYDDDRFNVTVSAGVSAPDPYDSRSFELMLAEARAELNKAIQAGGNQFIAENIERRLNNTHTIPVYVPSLDEALNLLQSNQGDKLDEYAQELLIKLMPLLSFCDDRLQLGLLDHMDQPN